MATRRCRMAVSGVNSNMASVALVEARPRHGHPLDGGRGPAWAVEWGEDRRFGPYAILEWTGESPTGKAARLRWRWAPPGRFIMGSPETEVGRYSREGPQHEVTLTRGFWICDTPVTQEFWQAVTGNNPSRFVDFSRPVENVSWNDVQDFVAKLNAAIPSLAASLPTEAQWEYACRAGSKSPLYPTEDGDGSMKILGTNNAPALDPIAWYGGNSGVEFELENGWDSSDWSEKQFPHRRAGTHPVARKKPNAWGLYDMLGNVWEWCADGAREYRDQPEADPVGPQVESRVIRGGGWILIARSVRCAFRAQHDVEFQRGNLGFRLVRVQEGS